MRGLVSTPLRGPAPPLFLPPFPLASRDSTLPPDPLSDMNEGSQERKSQGLVQVAPEFCTGVGLRELKGGPKALVTLNRLSGGQSLLEVRGGGEPRWQGLPGCLGVGSASPSLLFPLQWRREPEWI